MTVRVPGGEAEQWTLVQRVWIGKEKGSGEYYEVEHSRAYRDRLVLKLQGIEDGNAAEGLRGGQVKVAPADAPEVPKGRYNRSQLVGLAAVDEDSSVLGQIDDVVPTGGHDVLVVTSAGKTQDEVDEILVPFVPEIVLDVDLEAGRVVLRLPDGLRELYRQ
jgi:16S rRNA processing protein RimM